MNTPWGRDGQGPYVSRNRFRPTGWRARSYASGAEAKNRSPPKSGPALRAAVEEPTAGPGDLRKPSSAHLDATVQATADAEASGHAD
jgi:hypothetical protein